MDHKPLEAPGLYWAIPAEWAQGPLSHTCWVGTCAHSGDSQSGVSRPAAFPSMGNTASQAPPWNWWVDSPGAGPRGSTGPPDDVDLSLGIWAEGFSRPEDGSTCLIRVDVNRLAFSPTAFSQGMRCPSAFRTGDSSSCPGISTLSGDEALLDTWKTGKGHTCQDSWWGAAWNWKEQIDKPLGVGVQPREHSAGAEPGRWPALHVGSGLMNFSRLWTFIAKTRNIPGSRGQFVILKPSKNLGGCCSHAPHQHSSPLPQLNKSWTCHLVLLQIHELYWPAQKTPPSLGLILMFMFSKDPTLRVQSVSMHFKNRQKSTFSERGQNRVACEPEGASWVLKGPLVLI